MISFPTLTMVEVEEILTIQSLDQPIGPEWENITRDPIGLSPEKTTRKRLNSDIDLICEYCPILLQTRFYIQTSNIRIRLDNAYLVGDNEPTALRVFALTDIYEDCLAYVDIPVVG